MQDSHEEKSEATKPKNQPYTNLEIIKLEQSELEIRGDIPVEVIDSYRKAAVKYVSERVEIDGFRKGHVPEDVLVKQVGEMAIMEEMAERALADVYPAIIIDNELDVIGRPHISITKLARGNPVSFVAKTAVVPTFELPDYKAISEKIVKKMDNKVADPTEAEVDEAILAIRRRMAHYEQHHAHEDEEGHDTGEHGAHDGSDIKDEDLPALDDAFVQKLGSFATVAEFRTKIGENIKSEKEMKEKEKRRLAIVEALVEKATIALPKILKDSELDKMMGEFRSEIERMGVEPETYFQHLGKSPEDIRKEWEPEAEKRAKLQLILNAISEKETILLPEDKVARDVNHVLEHYKEANPDSVRMYVETIMRNEKVFEILEGKADKKEE